MRDAQVIRLTAEQLLPRVDELSVTIRARIRGRGASMPVEDLELEETLLEAAQTNIVAAISSMQYGLAPGLMELSDADRRLVDLAAEDPAGLPALLRIYRVGGEELWQMWVARVARQVDDVAQLDRVGRATSAHVSLYVDRASEAVSRRWVASVRAAGGLERRRTATIRALLAGEPADLADLGHPLDGPQLVLGLRRTPGTPVRVLGRAAREVLAGLGEVPRLDHELADGTLLAWATLPEPLPPDALGALLAPVPAGVWGTLVPAGTGATAIRAGGHDAQDALRVLERTRPGGGTAPHHDIALLAALLADEDRARRFADTTLGALADASARAGRLRATLRAHLATGSLGAAAKELGVHEKTVAHRLRQAEEALGAPLAAHRAELAAALEVHAALEG